MSADKRTVSTDALETLGTIIGPNEKRDAIHLAVLPVKAGAPLRAGMHINAVDGVAVPAIGGLGIVDPFIDGPIEPGQMFWMVLRPRLITSLRHVWTHPALPDEMPTHSAIVKSEPDKSKSEQWLRKFCETANCPSYDRLISLMSGKGRSENNNDVSVSFDDCGGDDTYLTFIGAEAHGQIPPEFWDHLEIVTGQKFSERPKHFNCSC